VLRLGAHQLLATRVGDHAAVATSVDLVKDVCGPRPSGFVNAVLRRVATRDLDSWIQIVAPDRSGDPSGYLAVRYSCPRWIVDAFRDALGPDAAEIDDALAAGNARPQVVLALSPGADGPLPDGERTRWSPYGFRLAGGDPAPLVASGSGFQAAVQDEASQLAALALTRTGGSGQDKLWLDLCAGPGGKARLLGGLAAERGARLVAADLHPHRARRVLDALARAVGENSVGHESYGVIAADGRQAPWPAGTFDRVLADVPCSGLGSLRRRPEARWRKAPGDVAELASLQRELLGTALDSVRPGGVVAYVTCSPHLAETRDVVTAVAQARDVTILDAPAVLAEVPRLRQADSAAGSRFAQFWPHRHGTDAIFLALLRRNGSGAAEGAG
jgi:16S rRNA (cytosine967-C5)-methyltransferase